MGIVDANALPGTGDYAFAAGLATVRHDRDRNRDLGEYRGTQYLDHPPAKQRHAAPDRGPQGGPANRTPNPQLKSPIYLTIKKLRPISRTAGSCHHVQRSSITSASQCQTPPGGTDAGTTASKHALDRPAVTAEQDAGAALGLGSPHRVFSAVSVRIQCGGGAPALLPEDLGDGDVVVVPGGRRTRSRCFLAGDAAALTRLGQPHSRFGARAAWPVIRRPVSVPHRCRSG